jgi:hypothetical protein
MDEIQKVIDALENSEWDWRTVDGIAEDTGLSVERVGEIIISLDDKVIRSSIPDEKGRALYTTRKHYKKTQSIFRQALNSASGSVNS